MARSSKEKRKQYTPTSCENTTISSINESPQSNIPSNIRLPNEEITGKEDANDDDSSNSNSDSVSIDMHRASVFDYHEWVTVFGENEDSICDNTTTASSTKKKVGWKCNFCQKVFLGRNATKVICHLAGVPNMNIKKCKGEIPPKHMNVIQARNALRMSKVDNLSKINKSRNDNTLRQQQSIVAGLELMAEQASKGKSRVNTSSYAGDTATGYCEKELDVAISDMIYSKGLPFNLTESHHFKRVLQLAKSVSSRYKLPTRKRISTDLLSATYNNRINEYKQSLQKEAEIFGLSFYGDGATVCKMPLMNIMASGVHERSAVLDIVDTTDHLSEGGTKDSEYISDIFLPHINNIDPKKEFVDTVFFDGAANVQKAGRVLAEKIPAITVLHGAEHVVSLF